MFVPISAFLQFLVSEVACGEQFAFLAFVADFWQIFLANLAAIKKLVSKNVSVHCAHHHRTRRHLCTKFDVLRPSQC